VRKTCTRCKEQWPGDKEFFRSETAIICRACNYEARVAQKQRRKDRQKEAVGGKEKKV
jgi:RNase P subunit RPR2